MCHLVCQWMKENKRKPLPKSLDEIEKICCFYCYAKRVKNYNKSRQTIIESYGFDDLFDTLDRENISNEMCHTICKWIVNNNKLPCENNSDEEKYMRDGYRIKNIQKIKEIKKVLL